MKLPPFLTTWCEQKYTKINVMFSPFEYSSIFIFSPLNFLSDAYQLWRLKKEGKFQCKG